MKPLRVAIIGAGHLGRIHTRLLSTRTDVDFVGIVEPQAETRARVAAEFLCAGYARVEDIAHKIDAALVVTPTQFHHDVALPLLERGIHCFIEKPITFSLDEADRLIETARRQNRVLQVGHVERFNPALRAVGGHTQGARYIEAVRTSGYAFRSIDIGVVLDLMIHDIDVVLSLAQSELVEVRAIGTPVLGPHEDMAQARLEFASGCVANLTASRTSFATQRTLQVFTPRGYARVDMGQRQAEVVQVGEKIASGQVDVNSSTAEEVQAIKERLFVDYLPKFNVPVPEANAIADEHEDFLNAIRSGGSPIVTGQAGRDALAVAYRILEAIARHQAEPRILPGPHTAPQRKAG